MSAILLIFILVIGIFYFTLKRKNKRFDELFFQLPSPPAVPILGHVNFLVQPNEILNNVRKYLLENKGIFAMHLPLTKFIFVSDPDIISIMCTSSQVIKSRKLYSIFNNWLGSFIFTAEGKLWKKYRTLFTPVFHVDVLEHYARTSNSVARLFVEIFKKDVGKPINIYHYVEPLIMGIVLESGLSFLPEVVANDSSNFVSNFQGMVKIMTSRVFNPLKRNEILFRFSRDYWKQRKAIDFLRKKARVIMEESLAAGNQSNYTSTKRKAKLFVDVLIDNKGVALSDEEIYNHILGMIFAGYDTLTTAISCVLYILSTHQHIQDKVFSEILEIYGEDRTKICTMNDVHKMQYLEMVIKETLRLYPPGPFIAKRTLEEFRVGQYVIPKGADVIIAIDTVHKTEKYFPNPDVFDPERFAPENKANIKPFTYMPFSSGIRNCAAKKFSILMMKIVVSMLLRNYKILPVEGFQLNLKPYIIQKPEDDEVYVRFQNRED